MKKIKNLRSKLIAIMALFVIMVADLNPFFVNAGRENLAYTHNGYVAAIYDNLDNMYHEYAISKIGSNQAYCIDYGVKAPANYASLSYMKTVRSNKLVSVISNGYPNKTVAELGAISVDAAYLGTQMAVWQTVSGTNYTKGKTFNLDNIQPNARDGYTELVENAKQVARNILAKNTYNPSISVTGGNVDYDSYVEMNKIGPFKVNVVDYNYTTFNVSLTNAPEGTIVVDKDNRPRDAFNKGEDVYVLVKKNANPTNVTLNVKAIANEKVGVIYGVSSNKLQNYVFLDFEQKEITASTTFTWERRLGQIRIEKVDQNGEKVPGVEFKVTDKSGKVITQTKTGQNGILVITDLPIGEYIVEEISAPDGYIMDSTQHPVTVQTGKTAILKIVNEKIYGGLEILKIDEDDKTPIENVKFEIYNSNKQKIGEITTGRNGKGIFKSDNMANGTYYYKEVTTPDGYVTDNKMYEFKITDNVKIAKVTVTNKKIRGTLEITKLDDSRVGIKDVVFNILASDKKTVIHQLVTDENGFAKLERIPKGTYYYQEEKVPDGYVKDEGIYEFKITNQGQVEKREVINERVKGTLKITKVDDTRVGIKGVKFNILASDKKTVIETLTTDESGYATSKELLKGTYYYKEEEVPDGYVKDEEMHEFKIANHGEVVKKEVINERVKGSLEILKIDEDTKEPIEGVTFEILASDKKTVIKTVKTDKDGKATVKDLLKGTYYYQEKEAPSYYKVNDKKVKFEINTNNQVVKQTVTNKRITGSIEITKVDDAKQPVEGVVFEIKDSKGNLVEKITTDKDGKAKLTKPVEKGVYTYKEVSAPDGYIMDTDEYSFEIKGTQTIKRTVKNERVKGYIEITKVDEENTPIKGVKFEILDSNKNVVDTITTDSNGKATSKELLIGKYYYREVGVPSAYVIDNAEYEFDITAKKYTSCKNCSK